MKIYGVDAISNCDDNLMIRVGDCMKCAGVVYLPMIGTEITITDTHTIDVKHTHVADDMEC